MQASIKTALLRHNQNLPRYTSYPPANFFSPCPSEGPGFYESWLTALPAGSPISLYLHIPFCPKMCWFCGCHTHATARYEPVTDYLELLRQEISLVANILGHNHPVAHVHFGGGSPTMLTPNDFTRLITQLQTAFPFTQDPEIAVEVDPRQITADKIRAYQAAGVTRVSMGVQDTDDNVMRAINRVQPFDMTARAVDMCRSHGLNHINIDLVYGLPHQTVAGIVHTVNQVHTLTPDRLALFGYAHVPWMKKHMRLIPSADLPNAAARLDLFTTGADALAQAGYTPIGIDHFARPDDALARSAQMGTLRRNFQGYAPAGEDLPIIGLGVSSISELPQGYAQNTPHMPHYRDALQDKKLPTARYHALTSSDMLHRAIIERLMCDLHVDLPALLTKFNHVPFDINAVRDKLKPLLDDGLAHITSANVVTVSDRLAVRMVAACFDTYRDNLADAAPPSPRHAAAV